MVVSVFEEHWQSQWHTIHRPLSVPPDRGTEATRAKARAYYADVLPIIVSRRTAGITLEAIAAELNAAGNVTQSGLPYTATNVYRLLARNG